MSGTKVMVQKTHLTPKSENCRKCIESPTGGISIFDNSPLEHASELFEPSKESKSCRLHWKKTWDLGSGCSMGVVRKG